MPTQSQLVFFADIAYRAHDIKKGLLQHTLPSGWQLLHNSTIKESSAAHNYCGLVFINELEEEIVFAHGGTNILNLHDLSDGLKLYNHDVPDKIKSVREFILDVAPTLPTNFTIFNTGHSMGGILSDIATIEMHKSKHPVKASYTFDNPGGHEIACKLFSANIVRKAMHDIIFDCVQARPNLFNSIGKQLGAVNFLFFSHRIESPKSKDTAETYTKWPFSHSFITGNDTPWLQQLRSNAADLMHDMPVSTLPSIAYGVSKIAMQGVYHTAEVGFSFLEWVKNTVKFTHTFSQLRTDGYCYAKLLEQTCTAKYHTVEMQYIVSNLMMTAHQLVHRIWHLGDHPLEEFMDALQAGGTVLPVVNGYGYGHKNGPITLSTPPRLVKKMSQRASISPASASSVEMDEDSDSADIGPPTIARSTSPKSTSWLKTLTPKGVTSALEALDIRDYHDTPVLVRSTSIDATEHKTTIAQLVKAHSAHILALGADGGDSDSEDELTIERGGAARAASPSSEDDVPSGTAALPKPFTTPQLILTMMCINAAQRSKVRTPEEILENVQRTIFHATKNAAASCSNTIHIAETAVEHVVEATVDCCKGVVCSALESAVEVVHVINDAVEGNLDFLDVLGDITE